MRSLTLICAAAAGCLAAASSGALANDASAIPAAVSLQAAAGGSATPDGGTTTDEEKAAEEARMNEVVCQRQAVIGSRVARRQVCMTRSEWARAQATARDETGRFIQDSTAGAGRGQ